MNKKPKKTHAEKVKEQVDKFNARVKHIKKLLKEEVPISYIANEISLNVKATRKMIRVRGLEINLTKPVLIGVR